MFLRKFISKQTIKKYPNSIHSHDIIWTKTDESPLLASYSLIPVFKKFLKGSNINLKIADISLSSRILDTFSQNTYSRDISYNLNDLSKLVSNPGTNIIKLPNVSASIPQLKDAIKELKDKGYNIPDYPDVINNNEDKKIQDKYTKILGSAVNPVLRNGNSDRRLPLSIKNFTTNNPYKVNEWNKDSKTCVKYMNYGSYYDNEISQVIKDDANFKIVFQNDKTFQILKQDVRINKGDLVDTSFMSLSTLNQFYEKCFEICKKDDLLLSLHLKATMMKKSDPIIFGEALKTYFKDIDKVLDKKLNLDFNNGLANIYQQIKEQNDGDIVSNLNIFKTILEKNAKLSYVNSDKGISNFHSPSLVIVDASMPALIKNGGKLWDKEGNLSDTLAIIPDKTYARIYETIIDDLKKNGSLDVSSIGSVSNIGLMANKAEEYGSHDKTFQAIDDGHINVIDEKGKLVFSQKVKKNDIWRMCITTEKAINNWIDLAIKKCLNTKQKTIFWLDEKRSHDSILIDMVKKNIQNNPDIIIKNYQDAMKYSLSKIRDNENVISVTGNVLRDYLTDLFPILEVGTSAKMLSIVPLLNGGNLFETGAGGTAPKHIEQLIEVSHLRWDSIGEYFAISESIKNYAEEHNDKYAFKLSLTLDTAIEKLLIENKTPKREIEQIDNKTATFYLCLFWSEELSKFDINFKKMHEKLLENKNLILDELNKDKGYPADLGGYWKLDDKKAEKVLTPSKILNSILK